MKVGILTLPNSTSYGASLQMFALYQALKKENVEPEIINYQNLYMKEGRHTSVSRNSRVKKVCSAMLHMRLKQKFHRFEKSMRMYPRKPLNQSDMLSAVSSRYDAAICGSDQVWNPDITGSDLSYFLSFCGPNTKRVSYAPSFGRTILPEDFQALIRRELEMFTQLSVRETDGQKLLKKIIEKDVPIVLDPSFLLDCNEWMQQESKYGVCNEPYILYYTVRSSHSLLRFCMDLAKKKNMKVVVVGGNIFSNLLGRNRDIHYACDIDPREWLYLLHHAQCVVTNSFHGTAFSINYQKDFYVEFSSLTNSRLENIIRIFGLEDRVIKDGKALSEASINYFMIADTMDALRKQSIDYLRKAVVTG